MIPKCPHCGKALDTVHGTESDVYEIDLTCGRYERNQLFSDIYAECPHCGWDVTDLFPEGVCNYELEKEDDSVAGND